MAIRRLRRAEQVERNRELLLAAARRVFLARGFHGATLDLIAEEAGFSKGVVYSQFESKADLFLALVAERIEERAVENERLAQGDATPAARFAALVRHAQRVGAVDAAWALVLLEFRVHAARDQALNARYARLHAQTVERLARVMAPLVSGERGLPSPREVATFLLAFGAGATLEAAVAPQALAPRQAQAMLARAFGVPDPAPPPPPARQRARPSRTPTEVS